MVKQVLLSDMKPKPRVSIGIRTRVKKLWNIFNGSSDYKHKFDTLVHVYLAFLCLFQGILLILGIVQIATNDQVYESIKIKTSVLASFTYIPFRMIMSIKIALQHLKHPRYDHAWYLMATMFQSILCILLIVYVQINRLLIAMILGFLAVFLSALILIGNYHSKYLFMVFEFYIYISLVYMTIGFVNVD